VTTHTQDATAELQALTAELKASWTGPATYRRAGDILLRIRSEGLYRAAAQTFKSYCRDVLDISDAEAYQTMKAARFATLLDAEAPELPAPATEFTFRPLGKLETEVDRLDCWRRTVERVQPATPTHEDVRATVDELDGDADAAPKAARASRTRTPRPEASKPSVEILAVGLCAVLADAAADPVALLDRLAPALVHVGLNPDRLDGAVRLVAELPSSPFILSLFVGDLRIPEAESGRRNAAPAPALTHDREPQSGPVEPKRRTPREPGKGPLTTVSKPKPKGKGKPAARPRGPRRARQSKP
jgi:hypothetical protein